MAPEFIVAVDLGQVADYTAICVLERREQPTGRHELVPNLAFFGGGRGQSRYSRQMQTAGSYSVVHLERLALGLSYVAVPERLRSLEDRLRQRWVDLAWQEREHAARLDDAPIDLVMDATGVGRPVLDLFRDVGFDPLGVTITSGDTVTRVSSREYRVPKRHLVSVTQALLQSGRVKAAPALADWPVLKGELANFKAKISLAGHDSYGAGDDWRQESQESHDDLVLALALGIWWGEYGERAPMLDPAIAGAWSDLPR